MTRKWNPEFQKYEVKVEIVDGSCPYKWFHDCVGQVFGCFVREYDYVVRADYIKGFGYSWRLIPFDCGKEV